jgi:signal transduction histidine kinase
LTLEQFQSKTSLDPDWNVIREDGSVFPGDQHPSMVALQTGKPVRNVVAGVYNPRQKKYVWLSINAIPQFKKNAIRPFQVFVTLHDITELKSIEKRLRQTQKLEALGTLAGGVAHDFNNLLYPIVGMAEMLMEDLPAESQGHDYAVEIFNAAWRGSELVRQILSFSRRSENETVPINLPQVLREALKLARSTIPSQVEMVADVLVEDCMVLAEPSQVHQIVMNLITNAYHAMESTGGTITVGLHKTAVSLTSSRDVLHEERQYVLLSVADTGCGIEPAVIDRIFEPYFTTKEQGKGSGLGLAMVYGIVREFKGDVKVVSKVGEGTTVEVYLPLLMDKGGGESVDSLIVIESGTERILVVDDDAVIVKLEQQMLERLGYRVIATTVSEEALQLFKDNPDSFDVVLTDMAMPGMTGDQLAREILRIRPSISVIVCTGFSEQFSNGEFEQIGIKGILKKPVVKSELARMMRKVLDA